MCLQMEHSRNTNKAFIIKVSSCTQVFYILRDCCGHSPDPNAVWILRVVTTCTHAHPEDTKRLVYPYNRVFLGSTGCFLSRSKMDRTGRKDRPGPFIVVRAGQAEGT